VGSANQWKTAIRRHRQKRPRKGAVIFWAGAKLR
jgi:hypothetical protein